MPSKRGRKREHADVEPDGEFGRPSIGRFRSDATSSTTSSLAPVGSMNHSCRRIGNVNASSSEAIWVSVRIAEYVSIDVGHAS